jgi:hypothetical protein
VQTAAFVANCNCGRALARRSTNHLGTVAKGTALGTVRRDRRSVRSKPRRKREKATVSLTVAASSSPSMRAMGDDGHGLHCRTLSIGLSRSTEFGMVLRRLRCECRVGAFPTTRSQSTAHQHDDGVTLLLP